MALRPAVGPTKRFRCVMGWCPSYSSGDVLPRVVSPSNSLITSHVTSSIRLLSYGGLNMRISDWFDVNKSLCSLTPCLFGYVRSLLRLGWKACTVDRKVRKKPWLTVYRRRPVDELEEFRGGVELVGRPDQKRRCDNFWSVLLRLERYLTIHFEKA